MTEEVFPEANDNVILEAFHTVKPSSLTPTPREFVNFVEQFLAFGEAGSDPRGHLGVTWGVYLCAGKPPLPDIILSHPPDLT